MFVRHRVDEEIEAVKFDGSEKSADAIVEKFGARFSKNKNRQDKFIGQVLISTPAGTKFVYANDFIVMSSKVGVSVFKEGEFNALFEEIKPIEETEGETYAEETGETEETQGGSDSGETEGESEG